MIHIFSIMALSSTAVILYILNSYYSLVNGRLLFTTFVMLATIERIWETFYTQKEKSARSFHGDWTLAVTVIMYYFVSMGMIYNFFLLQKKNIIVCILGLLLYLSAVILRYFSVYILGENWNIHLVSSFANQSSGLVERGPYKYIRHPIYLAAILELIGIMFIANTYMWIIIILFINVPLYVWRAKREERFNMKKFGIKYIEYISRVGFILPYRKR